MRQNQVLLHARLQRRWFRATLANWFSAVSQQISYWKRGETHPSPYHCEPPCQILDQDVESHALEPQLACKFLYHSAQHDQCSAPTTSMMDPLYPRLSLHPNYIVDRDQLVDQILEQLEEGYTCAIVGLPGVSKTILAQLILSHPSCATSFPHGCLWVNLGPSPDIAAELARLVSLLGGPEQECKQEHSIEAWSRMLHQVLGDRRILFIIDDAWTIEAVLPFMVGGQTVAHIIMTCLPQVALTVTDDAITHVPEFSYGTSSMPHIVPQTQ